MDLFFIKKHRLLIIIFLLFLLVLILFVLPLKITYNIKTVARIIPEREWILQRGNDGSLISSLMDYRSGFTESYSATQVERGDAIRFKMNTLSISNIYVGVGDTVGYINSNEIERRLSELKGSLEIARATLQYYLTGEKDAVITEALRAAELSREEAGLQKKLLNRQIELFEQELVSKESLEIAQTTTKISELEADLAEAKLQSVKTGAKPEQIDLIRSEINRFEREINVLEDRLSQFTIKSPIEGKIYKSFSSDTLLIAGTENQLILAPVLWSERKEIKEGSRISLELDGTPHGTILRVDNNIKVLNNEQVSMVVAELENEQVELPAYLYSICKIEGAQLTIVKYIQRFLQKMFSR